MKKWSLVVAALYGLLLMALFGPVVSIAFMSKDDFRIGWPIELLREWSFWLIIAVLILAQFALLRVPVAVAIRRPVERRSLWSTVLAAAFMMGLLVYGAGLSLWEFLGNFTKVNGWGHGHWVVLAVGLTSWAAWACYFRRATRSSTPEIQMGRLKRHLWTGSILDLLVAIPTHIFARHRAECCAGIFTFIGLTCGISVMLFAFGPAVYFLFVERWKRLHPEAAAALTAAAEAESRAVPKPPNLTHALRNFAVVTAALYGLFWSGAFWLLSQVAITDSMRAGVKGLEEPREEWVFWTLLAVLVLAQYAFLRVPVALAARQPIQPRSRWGTVLAASFLMGLLVLGAGISINEVLHGGIFDRESGPGTQISGELMLVSWLCWAIYFNLATQSLPLERAMHRLRTLLLFGSLLELVIAFAMHVTVTQRDYHYVGAMTFLGLLCGLAVLIFAFGPASYAVIVERWKRRHPEVR